MSLTGPWWPDLVADVCPDAMLDYTAIHRHLDSPAPAVIADLREWLYPHDPPPDPEWPAPVSAHEITATLRRMAWYPRVVAGLIFAELLADGIESLPADQQPTSKNISVRAVIAAGWRMLDGECNLESVCHAANNFAGLCDRRVGLVEGARLIADFAKWGVFLPMHSFRNSLSPLMPSWFGRWWQRVRSRIALADVGRADHEHLADILEAGLHSDNGGVQLVAISGLVDAHDPATKPALYRALSHRNLAVRKVAVTHLILARESDSADEFDEIRARIHHVAVTDANADVRRTAEIVLERLRRIREQMARRNQQTKGSTNGVAVD